MEQLFEEILASPREPTGREVVIGHSREGRPILGLRIGEGPFRISLIGGCHADEPAGPRLLRHLVSWLGGLPAESPLLRYFRWWIVPHANPDGEAKNRGWQGMLNDHADIGHYLAHVHREMPGEDMEFGFPHHGQDSGARPENQSLLDWWWEARDPFHLHLSLHGMGFAAGPWFLIEPAWAARCEELKERCRTMVQRLGYRLHDVERRGEKGFHRLEPGFCTRPNSTAMACYFTELGDPATAGRFRPSSMETIRALGGDPLTLVPEMPLFLLPGVGELLGPPDPEDLRWRGRIQEWKEALRLGPGGSEKISKEAARFGLRPMPFSHQMRLQWTLISAGVEQVLIDRKGLKRLPGFESLLV